MLKIICLFIYFVLVNSLISCSDKYSRIQNTDTSKSQSNKDEEKADTNSIIEIAKTISEDNSNTEKKYAISIYDTPVLNTFEFDNIYGGHDGKTLRFSKSGLVKELEYVAYPGAIFEIIDEIKKGGYSIYRVQTDDYDIVLGGTELFIDSRFVDLKETKPEKKIIAKPSKEQIYEYFEKSLGADYVWGANNINGVDKMLEFYKPNENINSNKFNHWCMKGVDCSGLIYEATNGFTPRNTHQMVSYGEGLDIEGKSPLEISEMLEPLDMIVWKGHVIYVYDKNTTIESAQSAGGVVKKDLVSTLKKIMRTRRPANKWSDKGRVFVVRRWW